VRCRRRQEPVGRTGGRTVAVCGRIDRAPLGVVEDVECFRAELEVHGLVNGKVLEQAHIEVRASRKIENVAAGVAIGEPLWCGKGVTVVEPRSGLSSGMRDPDLAVYIPHDIRIGLDGIALGGGEEISSPGIIRVDKVNNAEGSAGLKAGQVGDLPSPKRRMQKSGFGEEGNVIDQT